MPHSIVNDGFNDKSKLEFRARNLPDILWRLARIAEEEFIAQRNLVCATGIYPQL